MTEPLFVRVRNAEGKYLVQSGGQLEFCSDIKKARVFDCRREQVEHQLAWVRLAYGIFLEAEPVDPKEIHETCDRCGRLTLSFQMFFDGKQYLCAECRDGISGGLSSS